MGSNLVGILVTPDSAVRVGLQIAVGEEVAAFSEQLRPLVLLTKA